MIVPHSNLLNFDHDRPPRLHVAGQYAAQCQHSAASRLQCYPRPRRISRIPPIIDLELHSLNGYRLSSQQSRKQRNAILIRHARHNVEAAFTIKRVAGPEGEMEGLANRRSYRVQIELRPVTIVRGCDGRPRLRRIKRTAYSRHQADVCGRRSWNHTGDRWGCIDSPSRRLQSFAQFPRPTKARSCWRVCHNQTKDS